MEPAAPLAAPTAKKTVLLARPEPGKPLGRHVHHDPRSRNFPAERREPLSDVRHSAVGLPLRQADEHICGTAHSVCAAVNCSPTAGRRGRPLTEQDAVRIYDTATAIEPFSFGRTAVPGSSGLMACKAAQRLGLLSSYTHAFGVEHALQALMLRPVMTGINWYTSFDAPEPITGVVEITPEASVRGGHEVIADGVDLHSRLVWFWNSWGADWGRGGRFCMTFDTWGRLLDEDGDVTVPVV